jgi:hypothetical protein
VLVLWLQVKAGRWAFVFDAGKDESASSQSLAETLLHRGDLLAGALRAVLRSMVVFAHDSVDIACLGVDCVHVLWGYMRQAGVVCATTAAARSRDGSTAAILDMVAGLMGSIHAAHGYQPIVAEAMFEGWSNAVIQNWFYDVGDRAMAAIAATVHFCPSEPQSTLAALTCLATLVQQSRVSYAVLMDGAQAALVAAVNHSSNLQVVTLAAVCVAAVTTRHRTCAWRAAQVICGILLTLIGTTSSSGAALGRSRALRALSKLLKAGMLGASQSVLHQWALLTVDVVSSMHRVGTTACHMLLACQEAGFDAEEIMSKHTRRYLIDGLMDRLRCRQQWVPTYNQAACLEWLGRGLHDGHDMDEASSAFDSTTTDSSEDYFF